MEIIRKFLIMTILVLTLTGCGQFNELLWPGFDDERHNGIEKLT